MEVVIKILEPNFNHRLALLQKMGKKLQILETSYKIYLYIIKGGLRVKIGHHKIGACAKIGQNRSRGDGGSKKHKKGRTS